MRNVDFSLTNEVSATKTLAINLSLKEQFPDEDAKHSFLWCVYQFISVDKVVINSP